MGAELAAYDVGRLRPGGRVAKRFPDQRGRDGVTIPELAETIALAEALVAALAAARVTDRATVQSFDWRSLARVQEIASEIPAAYLTAEESWMDTLERGRPGVSPWTAGFDVDRFDGSTPRAVKAAGGSVWSPYYRGMRPAELREAHDLGLVVVVWTVNDPADMASLIDLGVDGIITDYPDRLRQVMAEKGMALPPALAGSGPEETR
jgi:glycerophosphoryl diester phosphodiesterase